MSGTELIYINHKTLQILNVFLQQLKYSIGNENQ